MHKLLVTLPLLMTLAFAGVGCSTAPSSSVDRSALVADAKATLDRFERVNPAMFEQYDDASVAVAAFPTVGKGGIGIGGAYGKGVLFENGRVVGYCDLTQASIGFQLGGQAYSEIIFFKDGPSLRDFKQSRFEFAAQASAVAVTADASTNADFDNGVAVFTLAGKGLMYEASIGGQKFSYVPNDALE